MLHSIFSYFIARGDAADAKRLGYLSWFVLQYPADEFRREEAIFRDFMEYCNKLSVPLKQKYLEVYMATELKKFLVESKVKIDGTENLSYDDPNSLETAIATTKEVMLANFRELEGTSVSFEDFPVDVDKFRKERLDERTVEILGRTYDLISQKGDPGGAASWAREQLAALADVYDESAVEEITDGTATSQAMEPLVDTGIPAIDNDLVSLCRTQLLDISAPPGAGKTRFALGVLAYRAALKGLNVLYFTLEQSTAEAKAMLIARHTLQMFGDIISDKMITTNSVPLELQPKVEAARIDGSGEFKTFNRIVFPLMKPAIAVQAIFTFVQSWNNYFIPALVLHSDKKKTLPVLIAQLRSADFLKFDMGQVYVMIAFSIFPVIIVYILLSKFIVEGVSAGAVKG